MNSKKSKKPTRKPQVNTLWKDEYFVQFDRLLGSGMTNAQACEALGVNLDTFNDWVRSIPALKAIVSEHRKKANQSAGKGTAVTNFIEFVYKRLSPELREYWDKINEHRNNPSAGEKIEAILKDAGENVRQHLFIHAVVACNFNMSQAMKRVNVSMRTLKRWKEDTCFSDLLNELQFHQQSFCEGALMELVAARSPVAVIFANRALNPEKYNPSKVVDLRRPDDAGIDLSKLSEETRLRILRELRGDDVVTVPAIEIKRIETNEQRPES